MVKYLKIFLLGIMLSVLSIEFKAQSHCVVYVDEGNLYIKIDNNIAAMQLDSLINAFDLQALGLKSALYHQAPDSLKNSNWELFKLTDDHLIIKRSILEFDEIEILEKKYWLTNNVWPDKPDAVNPYYVRFGFNKFKKKSVLDIDSTKTLFKLTGYETAKRVYLSGSFNGWSTLRLPMTKTDSGWVAEVDLSVGKHFYKFIVDGKWKIDPNNEQKESDGHLGFNSVFYKTNYIFRFNSPKNVKRVILAGSFNDWNERDAKLYKTDLGWELPVYIQHGSYEYQFIVDGEWTLDPANQILLKNEFDFYNSFISFGKKEVFYLDGYSEANQVYLAGDFNNWRANIPLKKAGKGWAINYALKPGNYLYRFVVDGDWVIDPLAEGQILYQNGDMHSVKIIEPNYTFRLDEYKDAKTVIVTGSFNGWNESSFTMQKDEKGWYISLHLPAGKHLYKFIVDGQWITDPAAVQNEKNDRGTYNSVLLMQFPQ